MSGNNSDAEEGSAASGSESDYEDMFEGWSLDDHIKEMTSLQREFQRIKRDQYEEVCQRIEARTKAINMGSDPEWKVQDAAMKKKQDLEKVKFEALKTFREKGADGLVLLAEQMHKTTIPHGEAAIKARMLETLHYRRKAAGKEKRNAGWIPPHLDQHWKVPFVPEPDDRPDGLGAYTDRTFASQTLAAKILASNPPAAGTGLTITDTLHRAGYTGWSESEDENDYQSRTKAFHFMNQFPQLATPPPHDHGQQHPHQHNQQHEQANRVKVPPASASKQPAMKRRAVGPPSKRVTVKPFIYRLHPTEIEQDLTALGC